MGELKIVDDFLPPPDKLVLKEDNVKVTLSLKKSSINFFKEQAKNQKTSYQKMIREVVDWYASHYRKSAWSDTLFCWPKGEIHVPMLWWIFRLLSRPDKSGLLPKWHPGVRFATIHHSQSTVHFLPIVFRPPCGTFGNRSLQPHRSLLVTRCFSYSQSVYILVWSYPLIFPEEETEDAIMSKSKDVKKDSKKKPGKSLKEKKEAKKLKKAGKV